MDDLSIVHAAAVLPSPLVIGYLPAIVAVPADPSCGAGMTAIRPPSQVLAETIARQRELVDRVLAEHVDDGIGHCTACPRSWQPEWRCWPCRLHSLATLARETLDATPGEHDTGSPR